MRMDERLAADKRRILAAFYPEQAGDLPPHGDAGRAAARQAIRHYQEATGDRAGTAELLLTFVETGTRFTCDYGDIDEGFYADLEDALEELAALLHAPDGAGLYAGLQTRLRASAAGPPRRLGVRRLGRRHGGDARCGAGLGRRGHTEG